VRARTTTARSRADVWFARKDEIARWALERRELTPVVHRGAVEQTGLPGPSASTAEVKS
jgi:hypothetical protein